MKKLLGTSQETGIIYLTASGTAAMEASVINCFDQNDKLLVIVGGTFGKRFADVCGVHGIPYEKVVLRADEELTPEHLAAFENKGFTGMLVNLHETSTGQLYDVHMLSDFCRRNGMIFVIDAISTFLCDPFNMDEFGADVVILSTQKGLCLAPGLSVVALSRRVIEERIQRIDPKFMYFDFKDYLTNIKRGQTPFTPAVGILYELNDMLAEIEKEGVEARLAHIRELCSYFRELIRELPVSLPKFPLSNAITPVLFYRPVAHKVFMGLMEKYDIFVNPCGGELADHAIRVAHIGSLTVEDHVELVNRMKEFL